jgi:DNA-binding NarL/FixJ family response regulator
MQRRLDLLRQRWSLTPRQTEVLDLLVRGHPNGPIAEQLGCSERTVEIHVTELLRRSGTGSRGVLIAAFWSDAQTEDE